MIQEYISFPKYDKNPVNNLFYYYYYYIEAKKKKIYPNTVFVITLCIEYLPQGFCSRKLNYTRTSGFTDSW